MKRDQEQDQFAGRLPGTGGDFIDTEDVEGHGPIGGRGITDEESNLRRDGETGLRRDGDDVEGHVIGGRHLTDDQTNLRRDGESELIKRAPGDNPHGER